jgi:hypothetical protein
VINIEEKMPVRSVKIAVQGVRWEGVDWHIMAEDREKWQTGWNIVMNNQVL